MSFTASDGNYNVTNTTISLDNTKEFEIEIKVIDEINEVVIIRNIDVGIPIFFISTTDENVYVGEDKVLTEADTEKYSLSETRTNKVFVDENDYEWPIYRRVFRGNCTSNNTISLGTFPEINLITSYTGMASSYYDWTWNIPNAVPEGYENAFRMKTSTRELIIYFGSYYSTSNTYNLTIEYTKTIDAPASL